MQAQARLKHIRITPQKARRVVNMIRGRQVEEALAILRFAPQAAAATVYKLLASARANLRQVAIHNQGRLDEGNLFVARVYVDEGATLKRFRPRAKGSAGRILKRTSHITVVVSEPDTEGK